jgi:K+-transporting ATPase ATPase A chain
MWLFPISVIAIPALLAFPLSRYLAWIMDDHYRPPKLLKWFEDRLGHAGMNWKQYTIALLLFNLVLYVFGYIVLSLQSWMPPNPRGLGALAPSTIFNTVISFITNTDIQHYSGDVAFSNFSQMFFCLPTCGLTFPLPRWPWYEGGR